MSEEVLLMDKKDMVCTLTLNRPDKRNSLSPTLLFKLADALNELNGDDSVRCVVIKGAGDKAFSAGYDISEIPNTPEGRERLQKTNPLQTGLKGVTDYKYPVIAMISGYGVERSALRRQYPRRGVDELFKGQFVVLGQLTRRERGWCPARGTDR